MFLYTPVDKQQSWIGKLIFGLRRLNGREDSWRHTVVAPFASIGLLRPELEQDNPVTGYPVQFYIMISDPDRNRRDLLPDIRSNPSVYIDRKEGGWGDVREF